MLRPHEPRGPAARAWPAVGAVTCVCGWLARACQPGGRGLAGAAPLVAGLGGVHVADPGEATGRVLMAPGGCPPCLMGWGGPEPVLGWLPTLPAQALHTPHGARPAGAGGWLWFSLPGGEPLLESALDCPALGPGALASGPCTPAGVSGAPAPPPACSSRATVRRAPALRLVLGTPPLVCRGLSYLLTPSPTW